MQLKVKLAHFLHKHVFDYVSVWRLSAFQHLTNPPPPMAYIQWGCGTIPQRLWSMLTWARHTVASYFPGLHPLCETQRSPGEDQLSGCSVIRSALRLNIAYLVSRVTRKYLSHHHLQFALLIQAGWINALTFFITNSDFIIWISQ